MSHCSEIVGIAHLCRLRSFCTQRWRVASEWSESSESAETLKLNGLAASFRGFDAPLVSCCCCCLLFVLFCSSTAPLFLSSAALANVDLDYCQSTVDFWAALITRWSNSSANLSAYKYIYNIYISVSLTQLIQVSRVGVLPDSFFIRSLSLYLRSIGNGTRLASSQGQAAAPRICCPCVRAKTRWYMCVTHVCYAKLALTITCIGECTVRCWNRVCQDNDLQLINHTNRLSKQPNIENTICQYHSYYCWVSLSQKEKLINC